MPEVRHYYQFFSAHLIDASFDNLADERSMLALATTSAAKPPGMAEVRNRHWFLNKVR
jgi:hypothetical protein